LALKDYERGQGPVSVRPADLIEPEMEQAREAIKDISSDPHDVLTFALYPTTGLRFLRIKHGLEEVPEDMKPAPSSEQTNAASPKIVRRAAEGPPKSSRTRRFNVYVQDEFFEVEVDPTDPPRAGAGTVATVRAGSGAPSPAASVANILAPMPGIVLRYLVEVGQSVTAGDPVVVLEAMKMENTLPAPVDGTVGPLPLGPGSTVKKDQVLATITA
jgi:biotin carboxyl carrier protein